MTNATELDQVPKEKKTRRRLRLSCVECTKRRQRCDRNYPCGLCTQRGVAHLCRWETVPVARPAPARPPDHAGTRSVIDSEARIRELSERIAMLERSLESKASADQPDLIQYRPPSTVSSANSRSPNLYTNGTSSGLKRASSTHSDSSHYSSPEPSGSQEPEEQSLVVLSQEAYECACKLMHATADLRGEYLGNRGAWDLLHSILTDGSTPPKNVQSSLIDITSAIDRSDLPVYPQTVTVEQLVERLPTTTVLTVVLSSFFTEVNWNFGLPEHWLYTTVMRMWNTLRYPDIPGTSINACWLSLLFAIIASTPRTDPQFETAGFELESQQRYFSYAKIALAIAEESFNGNSRASPIMNGGVFGCLAVPLLCASQVQEGRLGESWKLLGSWIRIAQTIGVHQDPDRPGWHGISEEEKCLRKLAWCNLATWDKLYSMVLGRPQMVGADSPMFVSSMLSHPDGASNFFSIYQSALIKLGDITGEINLKCISAEQPQSKTVAELDDSLQQWKSQLPFEYRIRTGEHLDFNVPSLTTTLNFRQWYTLSMWYLYGKMKLHLGYLTKEKPSHYSPTYPPYLSRKQSRDACVSACLDILRLQCESYDVLCRFRMESVATDDQPVPAHFYWDSIGTVVLYEAVIGLASLLTRSPIHGAAQDIESVIGRSIQMFASLSHAREGPYGDITQTAATLLGSLHRELSVNRINGSSSSHSMSRTPSPPSPAHQATHHDSMLVFDSVNVPEGSWMGGTSDNWYDGLAPITPPTVDIYAQSHARDELNRPIHYE